MSQDPNTEAAIEQDFSKLNRQIWTVGIGLMVGAAISVTLCSLTWSTHSHIVICLLVAAVQVSTQVLVFMHLKSERGIIFKFLVFTIFFVMALFVLTRLAQSDPLHDKVINVK